MSFIVSKTEYDASKVFLFLSTQQVLLKILIFLCSTFMGLGGIALIIPVGLQLGDEQLVKG